MPTLTLTKSYTNGVLLYEADLDNFKTGMETFLNTTKLDSANVQAGGLTGSNLANNTVTATQLGAGAVTTAIINNNAVTTAKMAAYNKTLSATDNNNTAYSTTLGLATLNTVAITASGVRPVLVGVGPGTAGSGACSIEVTTGTTGEKIFSISDGTTTLQSNLSVELSPQYYPGSYIWSIFYPSSAGSVTYTWSYAGSNGDSLHIWGRLFALEL